MNIEKTLYRMIILLAFTGSFYIRIINQAVFAFAAILCMLYIVDVSGLYAITMRKKDFIVLMITAVSVFVSLIMTDSDLYNSNMPLYYAFWFIYVVAMTKDVESFYGWIIEDRSIIEKTTKLWCIITAICALIPRCYVVTEEGRGFVGFTGVEAASGGNRLCPIALLMMTMVYLCMTVYKEKRMIIYSIPCMYVFFMGGSRTYFAVGCALFVILFYNFFEKKRYFYMLIIPVIVVGYMMISVTAIGTRIEGNTWTSNSYGDYWYVLTSGRSVFWTKMLKAYSEGSIFHKIFGNGFNFTMDVGRHWGHNDFVEILCCFGIVGIITYLYSIYQLFKVILNGIRWPILIRILVVFVWMFNAFFNMFYTYLTAALSYPILLYGIAMEYGQLRFESGESEGKKLKEY